MKVRDSGMPEENVWNEFFDTEGLLTALNIDTRVTDLVEIGSGYGTFTIQAAKRIRGKLYAFDFENGMVEVLQRKLDFQQIHNVVVKQRDILEKTSGLPDNSIDYVMMFNILHHDSPSDFINEAYRILKPGGRIGIIHWRSDIATPRGPELSIRPTPEQIIGGLDRQKFRIDKLPFILEPYHFGIIISKL
jgi:ubiquinone/menaquinone biosynthesis C-methylase UbiE